MRRRRGGSAKWPASLLSFDPADWAGEPSAADLEAVGYGTGPTGPLPPWLPEAVALRRWSAAREAFAEAHGLDYVRTMIGGRCWRRLAFLEGMVTDPRERQHTWDRPG